MNTIRDIAELLHQIWPPGKDERNVEWSIDDYMRDEFLPINKSILIWENNLLIGHTEIFSRKIETNSRMINNMALANVCVRPGYSGNNYGIEMVKTAFDFVDNQHFECSIFQTELPDFYRKFGCQTITNEFINSQNTGSQSENPWWNTYVMIYPGEYNIGFHKIDLNGKGY